MSPDRFVEKIRSKLADRRFDRYVSISHAEDRLLVELRWMGTTRFVYRVVPQDDGFRAELIDQRVAPMHAAFGDRFESYIDEALAKVGGTVT